MPNLQLELWKGTAVFGMAARTQLGPYWAFTLVLCTQCGRTDVFTTNGAELATHVPGTYPARG
jgi:hypothetical protein